MSRIEQVGIIGLGKMGRPMAKNLVAGGFWLTGYDVNGRAVKAMTIVLHEADSARISLPLSGTIKEVIKGIKIARGQSMPRAAG